MTRREATSPAALLHDLFPASLLRQEAAAVGLVQRVRKVDVVQLFLAVVLTVSGRGGQTLAALRRSYIFRSGQQLARSAFWRRLSPAFAQLCERLLVRMEADSVACPPRYGGVLRHFRDVIAVDATVVRVHDSLEDVWPGTRRHSSPAAIKIHTWVRAVTGELLKHRITKERHADSRAFGVDWSAAGKLFLFDRGYPSASLWHRIDRVGGYFLTRLPSSYDPLVVDICRSHRGRARKLIGEYLYDAEPHLKRKVIDVRCTFRVHIRGYRGKRGRYFWEQYRVVGLFNEDTAQYHYYVTNIPPQMLRGEAMRDIYRLRWEAETFYKTAKGGLGLNELSSSKKHVVELLVRAALIRASVAMRAKAAASRPLPRTAWINPGQWLTIWRQILPELLDAVARGRRSLTGITWPLLGRLAADPNRSRPPTRTRCVGQVTVIQGVSA